MSVEVRIDRLVLDGIELGPAERPRLQAAVERELGRLLAAGMLTPEVRAGGRLASLAVPPLELAPGAGGEALGGRIAASLAGGLSR